MTWTAEHRRAADRRGLRYPSDMTDAKWALVQPIIRPAKRGGLCCINAGGAVHRLPDFGKRYQLAPHCRVFHRDLVGLLAR